MDITAGADGSNDGTSNVRVEGSDASGLSTNRGQQAVSRGGLSGPPLAPIRYSCPPPLPTYFFSRSDASRHSAVGQSVGQGWRAR